MKKAAMNVELMKNSNSNQTIKANYCRKHKKKLVIDEDRLGLGNPNFSVRVFIFLFDLVFMLLAGYLLIECWKCVWVRER